MNISNYYSQIATQGASLSALPLWYPWFAKSLYIRKDILISQRPGDLSHTIFFKKTRNYYRGISANLLMQPLFPLTDMVLNSLLRKIEQANQREPNFYERIGAGMATGASTVWAANPYEVTVLKAQSHRESPLKAFVRVLRSSGVKGFYTGAVPMAFRNAIFVSGLFVTAPALHKKTAQYIPGSGKIHDMATMVLAATLPAAIYTTASAPLDVMAIMRQSDPSRKLYPSGVQAIKAAFHKHGLAAVKAGLGNRLAACTIEIAAFNVLRNLYMEALGG